MSKSKPTPKYSRRLVMGAGAAAAFSLVGCKQPVKNAGKGDALEPSNDEEKQKAVGEFGPWLTEQDDFHEVTRSRPYLLPPEKLAEVGLTRETWKLEIDSDVDHPSKLGNPMTRELGTAFSFSKLMEMAKTKSVRFAKSLSCLNNHDILGSGVWEGVPLRDVMWLADPKRNIRRIYYYGYHGDDDRQIFRSSLPVGRVLEDAFGLPPVILCYKLNGQWLSPKRGGPVRMVVPEAYAFKSVKWLSNVKLTNLETANDSYAKGNNDIDTHMKSFARFVGRHKVVKANEPFVIKGYAQVGVSGVDRVQVWAHNTADGKLPLTGRFEDAPWQDGEILPAPKHWGGSLEDGKMPADTIGFDSKTNVPSNWPMPFTKTNWLYFHPGLKPGTHLLRCRTIDQNGNAQPMPRPFQKSGHAKIDLWILKAK